MPNYSPPVRRLTAPHQWFTMYQEDLEVFRLLLHTCVLIDHPLRSYKTTTSLHCLLMNRVLDSKILTFKRALSP